MAALLITLAQLLGALNHGWVDCPPTAITNGRVYLPCGVDAGVWPGCAVALTMSDSNIVKTTVAYADTGYAVSAVLDRAVISPNAEIVAVAVRSLQPITSPVVIWSLLDLSVHQLASDDLAVARTGVSVSQVSYAFESGTCRTYLGWRTGHAFDRRATVVTEPAPVVAALIPNLSSEINREGMLTTALRYQLDSATIDNLLEVDRWSPVLRWLPRPSGNPASLVNPERGVALLRTLPIPDSVVTIAVASSDLLPLARWLRDRLIRHRWRARIITQTPADLNLTWVPVRPDNDSDGLTLVADAVTDHLNVLTASMRQELQAVRGLLARSEATADSSIARHLLLEAERRMLDDWGVFPLARPDLVVTLRHPVFGAPFSNSGQLTLDRLRFFALPEEQP